MAIQDLEPRSKWDRIEIKRFLNWKDPAYPNLVLENLDYLTDKRKLPHATYEEIPKAGVLVCYDSAPVAMGFLRQCEGSVGIFDSLISNPEIDHEIRTLCVDAVFENILRLAKQLNINNILGFSINERTLVRGEKFGFQRQPFSVSSLRLEKD